jgi:hypothetical protein
MTRHLAPGELIAAMDRTLDTDRAAHLRGCAACQASLSGVAQAARTASAASHVPEPASPFWDDLSERVRRATAARPVPARGVRSGRVVAALGAAAAVALVVWTARPPVDVPADAGVGALGPVADDWRAMGEIAAGMSADDVRRVTASAPDGQTMLADLSVDERRTFVRLLTLEMGGAE